MQITVDVGDLETLFDVHYSESITPKDLKQHIVDLAVEKYVNELYNQEERYTIDSKIDELIKAEVDKHKDQILGKVIDKVAEKIATMKMIKEQMPKASEITAIDKEWQAYFEGLIDKALKKKFR